MRQQRAGALFEEPFEITILLLKMLRLEEHALRPDNPIVPAHIDRASETRKARGSVIS
jgi:hypothetical protein